MDAPVTHFWIPATLEAMLLLMAAGFGLLWLLLLKAKKGADRSRRMVFTAFLCLLGLLFGRAWFIEPFFVPSASMVPTLHVGDMLLVQKFPYRLTWPITGSTAVRVGAPKRGEVVVFSLAQDPDVRYVKRVVGLPGDQVVHWQGQWFVNGKRLDHQESGQFEGIAQGPELDGKKAFKETLAGHTYVVMEDRAANAEHWEVPSGRLFVLGDNRGMSKDSREFGFVEEDRVLGRVARVMWNTQQPGLWAQALGDDFPARLR